MVHFPVVEEQAVQTDGWGGFARHLPALAIFAVASVALTWPLVLDLDATLVSWGDPVFQSWTIAWNWHALSTDPRNIFDANVFYPWANTLAYSDHLFGQTLSVLPVIALTENGILADNIAVLLAFFFSALAMYLLVYDLTRNPVAGILAGIAYAFAPARMAHLEHLHLLSAQWPPLLLLCLRRVVITPAALPAPVTPPSPPIHRGERLASESLFERPGAPRPDLVAVPRRRGPRRLPWLVALGACFFAQGLFGIYFLYFTIAMLLIAGGTYAAFALYDRDWRVIRSLLLAGLASAIAGLLLVPTLLPYLQVNADLDVERTTDEVEFWSARPRDYLAVWPRNRAWNELLGDNHRDIEQDLFPGLFLLALAGIGLTYRRAGRARWVLLAVTLGSVMLSFGLSADVAGINVPLPYRVLFEWVPGFRAIRVPARLGLLALVGLAALAGLGIDRLLHLAREELPYFRWYPDRLARSPWMLWGVALVCGLALLFGETATRMELPDPLPRPPDEAPPAYAWIRDHPAPALELPMGEGPVASAWPNFWSMMHWNDVVNGYSGIVPPTYYPFRERMRDFPSDDVLALLQGIGVENVIIHADFPGQSRDEVERAIRRQPELTLRLAGPDAVYTLARDPWMWRLAAAVPEGEPVDLPNAAADPVAFGLLMAILQRTGHDVTGRGTVDYFTFPEAGSPRCHVILLADDDPADFGYDDVERLRGDGNMTLYRNRACE